MWGTPACVRCCALRCSITGCSHNERNYINIWREEKKSQSKQEQFVCSETHQTSEKKNPEEEAEETATAASISSISLDAATAAVSAELWQEFYRTPPSLAASSRRTASDPLCLNRDLSIWPRMRRRARSPLVIEDDFASTQIAVEKKTTINRCGDFLFIFIFL